MDNTSPPPPPPPIFQAPPLHSPKNSNFPVIAIAVIGILATAFLLISYYIFVIKCCLTWHRVDVFNRFFSRVRDQTDEDGLPTYSTGFINSEAEKKGLDEALIRSIPVIEFRKLKEERRINDAMTMPETGAAYECAVCLSEFQEGERLRVIPNCCHAFHIDCIDVWLQSNANCPLCRSAISPSSILYSNISNSGNNIRQNVVVGVNAQRKDVGHDTNENDDDDDYVVIEIQGNNLDEPRLVTRESEKKRLRHVWSLGDELIDIRKIDEEFQNIQPIRRSISMDLSSDRQFCVEIQQCCSRSISSSCNNNVQENEVSGSGSNSNYSKVRRSIFSFGYGRSSRCSVQPVVHLDP